jgi:hypothetical protein
MNLAIITPTHKSLISTEEHKRLTISLRTNFSAPHFFVIPDSLDTRNISMLFPNSKFEKFNDTFFSSIYNFNYLMLDPSFYERFIEFDYVLICQFDAFLVKSIEPILKNDFTYLGPSWNPSIYVTKFRSKLYFNRIRFSSPISYKLQSGTGGLSLRKTRKLYELLTTVNKSSFYNSVIGKNRNANEDILITYILNKFGYPIVSKEIADTFFIESTPRNQYNINNIFGFHRLSRYDPVLERSLLDNF